MSIPALPMAKIEYRPAGWHLNLNWSLEDMWFIESEAASGHSAKEIADSFDVDPHVIRAVCQRNGIEVSA